jgi:acetyl-CoA carboxylase biotin carboxyl carrier protein
MASRPLKQPAERGPGPQAAHAGRNRKPATEATAAPGFSFEDVKQLVRLVEKSDVSHLAWQRGGEKVVIRRGGSAAPATFVQAAPAAMVAAPVGSSHPAPAVTPAGARDPKLDQPGVVVSSPFVGTFYRSPSPDAPPFADVGQKVKKGQTLCIIEAMKLMNEIECEVDGTVAEIMVPNATPVEFGEALFRIVPG